MKSNVCTLILAAASLAPAALLAQPLDPAASYKVATNDFMTGEDVVVDGGLTMRIA